MPEDPFAAAPTLPPEAAQPPREAAAEGQIVDGRYRLIRKLGEGGMGAVFLAEHLQLKKQVALKTIHASFEGHAEVAARFAREAMASARIEHPHVVSALDFGTLADGTAFLVMQLARGEGLRARMEREGAMPFALASLVVEQMADGVAAAHAAGIVHRDLKPENVVLEPSDGAPVHVRVLDFGIAHLRSDADCVRSDAEGVAARTQGAPLTRLGVVMGTPGYMAPEQALGEAVDERADIYALGVMLWELCAGRPPFAGDTLTAIVTQQFASPPALPDGLGDVPPALAPYLAQLLAPRPEDRPRSAAELRDRLRALRLAAVAPASSRTRVKAVLGRPRPLLVGLAAVALALLLALFARRREGTTTDATPTTTTSTSTTSTTTAKEVREVPASRRDAPPSEASREPAQVRDPQPGDAPSAKPGSTGKPAARKGKARREGIRSRVRRTVDAIFR